MNNNILIGSLITSLIIIIVLIIYVISLFEQIKKLKNGSDNDQNDLIELKYDYNKTEERLLAEQIIKEELKTIDLTKLFNNYPENQINLDDTFYTSIITNEEWKNDVYVLKNTSIYFKNVIINNEKFSELPDYDEIIYTMENFINSYNNWIPHYKINPDDDYRSTKKYYCLNWEIFLVYLCKFFIYYILWNDGKNTFKTISAKNLLNIIKIGSQNNYLEHFHELFVEDFGPQVSPLTSNYTITVNNCRIVGCLEGVSVIYLLIAYKYLYSNIDDFYFNVFSNYLTNIIKSLNDNLEDSLNENYTLLYNINDLSLIKNVIINNSKKTSSIKLDSGIFDAHLSNIDNIFSVDENIPINVSVDNCLSLFRYFYAIELLSNLSSSLMITNSNLYKTIGEIETLTKHPTLYNSSTPLYIGDDYTFSCGLNGTKTDNFGINIIPSIKYLRLFTQTAAFNVTGADLTTLGCGKALDQFTSCKFYYNGLLNLNETFNGSLIEPMGFKSGYLGTAALYNRNIIYENKNYNIEDNKFIGLIKPTSVDINSSDLMEMTLVIDSKGQYTLAGDEIKILNSCVFYDKINNVGISHLHIQDKYKEIIEFVIINSINDSYYIDIYRKIKNNTTEIYSHVNDTTDETGIISILPSTSINVHITYDVNAKSSTNFTSTDEFENMDFVNKIITLNELIYTVKDSYIYFSDNSSTTPIANNNVLYLNDNPIIICPTYRLCNNNIIYDDEKNKFSFNKMSNQWLFIAA